MSVEQSWIDWLIEQPLGQYFVPIDREFLENMFSYYGLRQKVPNFKQALEIIKGPYLRDDIRPKEWPSNIDEYGLCLYGLLHARFLLTESGLQKMRQKYCEADFHVCPRTLCRKTKCLPYGPSDDVGQSSLRIFCPKCRDIYAFPEKNPYVMDGAFFGPSWVHVFVQKFPEIFPQFPTASYTPLIFGFKICDAKNLPPSEDEDLAM